MTAQQTKTQYFAVLGIFLLAGLVMVSFGAYWLILTKRFLAGATLTSGVVVDLKQTTGRKVAFRPVFRFKDTEGIERVVDELTASSTSSFCVGQTVPVAYPSSDPRKARINSFSTLWGFPVFIASMGTLFTAVPSIGFGLVLFGSPRHKPWVT